MFEVFGRKPEITIDVHDAKHQYVPGDTVDVTITLNAGGPIKAREIRAGLVFWHKYQAESTDAENDTTYVWKTDETWVTKESLSGDPGRSYHFAWQIPADAAPTYAGSITHNRWLAKVTVDRKLARDINEEMELPVVVPPTEDAAPAGEYGEVNATDMATMQFSLPALTYVEGDTVAGRLTITPQQTFEVRSIRVELVRRERVQSEDGTHTKEIVAHQVTFAEKTELVSGRPLAYTFEAPVPANGHPSHGTSNSDVTWQLKAVLDRTLRTDVVCTQEIVVRNGAGRPVAAVVR